MIITGDAKLYGKKYQECECGQAQIIVADQRAKDVFAEAAADGAFDVFLCQDERGICSGCGCEVVFPVPEMLDLDRSEQGQSLIKMITDIQAERKRPDYEPPPDDILF